MFPHKDLKPLAQMLHPAEITGDVEGHAGEAELLGPADLVVNGALVAVGGQTETDAVSKISHRM